MKDFDIGQATKDGLTYLVEKNVPGGWSTQRQEEFEKVWGELVKTLPSFVQQDFDPSNILQVISKAFYMIGRHDGDEVLINMLKSKLVDVAKPLMVFKSREGMDETAQKRLQLNASRVGIKHVVVISPEMDLNTFNDEDLRVLGLQRIESAEKGDTDGSNIEKGSSSASKGRSLKPVQ